jgi:HEAT repeat protein
MDGVIASTGSAQTPSALDISRVFDTIPNAPRPELERAIPSIIASLKSENSDLKRVGIIAVYCIDQRNDSASIDAPMVETLLDLLKDQDPSLVALAARSISSMKPHPPESVIAPFTEYLNSGNSFNESGAAVLFALARLSAGNEKVSDAIVSFLQSEKLSTNIRVASLNALAYPGITDNQVIMQIGEDLRRSRQPEIRVAAIHALQRIGPRALQLKGVELQRLSTDINEDSAVREAATAAIK